jgi:hypothetical protein
MSVADQQINRSDEYHNNEFLFPSKEAVGRHIDVCGNCPEKDENHHPAEGRQEAGSRRIISSAKPFQLISSSDPLIRSLRHADS